MLDRAGRFWRSARHLRARQIADRLTRSSRLALARKFVPAATRIPSFHGCRPADAVFVPPALEAGARPRALAGALSFVNLEATTGWPPAWNRPEMPALWRYHLHYFDLLWALRPDEGRILVSDWIRNCTPEDGSVGWDPYPTSLRLMNWTTVLFGRDRTRTLADEAFRDAVWTSICRQARWLRASLEWHLLANHLLENAAALALVGCWFEGPEAGRWKRIGLRLLERELPEQILPDGVHFERSPMYQCRVAQVLLNLRAAADPDLDACIGPHLDRLMAATARLAHADGRVALFNDSALGTYPAPDVLLASAGRPRPEPGPFALEHGGYYGHAGADGSYILCDAGAVGPDYFPAHAHADTLSFEWSVRGRRLLTDSGVFDYEPSEMRRYCRGTAAHNTVTVEGEDQSEMWAAFRVGRRARPVGVAWEPRVDGFRLEAGHDGYRRIGAEHRRVFEYRPGRLVVRDRIEARRSVEAVARFHLAPGTEVDRPGAAEVRITLGEARVVVRMAGEGRLDVEQGWLCDRFHRRRARPVLRWTMAGSRCEAEALFETTR